MINYVYQLLTPRLISAKYKEIGLKDKVIVKPTYMAICHADQRYYLGNRSAEKLKQKLPMALIHECVGRIVFDPFNKYKIGQKVVLIPNVPVKFHNEEFYENYEKGSKFLSSGVDGFMRELVDVPSERIVPYGDFVPESIAAICEFISVAVHAVDRFKNTSHSIKSKIGIWGDGSLAYVTACILKQIFPDSEIAVIGRDSYKLYQFSFVEETYFSDDIPRDFCVDHAFECAGGEGSYYAIDDIIRYINPQGTVMLLGVSENKVAINTRDILEKGLTFIGSSRSGIKDFRQAVLFLENEKFRKRINRIIFEDKPVNCVQDIHRIFETDLKTPFKTVFKWNL